MIGWMLINVACQTVGIGSDRIIGAQNMVDLGIDDRIIQPFYRMIGRAQNGEDADKKSIELLNQQFPVR